MLKQSVREKHIIISIVFQFYSSWKTSKTKRKIENVFQWIYLLRVQKLRKLHAKSSDCIRGQSLENLSCKCFNFSHLAERFFLSVVVVVQFKNSRSNLLFVSIIVCQPAHSLTLFGLSNFSGILRTDAHSSYFFAFSRLTKEKDNHAF